jgi:hypothetical protein
MREWAIGDCVVYRKYKISPHPTPRAKEVYPAPGGETYSYAVDKYWVVSAVHAGEKIETVTRTGKVHSLDPSDPNLRKASLFEKLRLHDRFPRPAEALDSRHQVAHPFGDHSRDDLEKKLFFLFMLMFLVATTSIVLHLTKFHLH